MLQNIDYAAPSNHDVFNEVELSSDMSKSLLSSDSEQKTKYAIHFLNISCE